MLAAMLAQAADTSWLKSQIDVPTLAAVIMAAVLAFEGYQRRKTARNLPPTICPHKVDGLDDAVKAVAKIEKCCEHVNEAVDKAMRLLDSQDSDGVPRVYSRDQGRTMIGIGRDILRGQQAVELALEVIKTKLNGRSNGS